MIKTIKSTVNTRCQTVNCNNEVQSFNLSTRENCPKLGTISINRELNDKTKMSYRDLEKSIRTYGCVFQPILISSDNYILDGQHRWKIVQSLWNEGIDVCISMVTAHNVKSTDPDIMSIIIDLQKGHAWTPEDKVKSLAKAGNETAQYVLELANKQSAVFSKGKRFGIRNALVLMGRNPADFDIPEIISQEDIKKFEKLYQEINFLITVGIKSGEIANNWTEALIKAWRRIRLSYENLEGLDSNGVKTPIDAKVLNNMVEEIGITEIAMKWRQYADVDSTFSSAKISRWLNMLYKTIIETHEWKTKLEKGII